MVAIQIESRVETFEEGFGSQTYRIAEDGEVNIGVEVESQLSGIGSYNPCLGTQFEVEGTSLSLAKLSAEANAVF